MASDRFKPKPPSSEETAALGRVEAALEALTQAMANLGQAPQVHVAPPTVTAPSVDVHVPTEGMSAAIASALMDAVAAMPSPTINVPPSSGGDGALSDVAITTLLDAQEAQRGVMEALQERIANIVASPRSHFDGRLRSNDGLIGADNPLPVSVSGSEPPTRRIESNSTTTPLDSGNPTFTGDWFEIDSFAALSFFAISDQPFTTARLEWSDDGVTPNAGFLSTTDYLASEEVLSGFYIYYPDPQTYMIAPYARVVLENTGTDQTSLEAFLWAFPHGSQPFTFTDASGPLSTLSKAMLVRTVNPPVEVARWTDVDDGTIPSGAMVTVDPVLNTESNVLDSGWVDVQLYNGKNIINVLTDVSVDVYLMNATDDQGANIFGAGAPVQTTVAGFPSQLSALFPNRYFRVLVVNSSGTSMTDYSIRDVAAPDSTDGITTGIDQPVFGFYPAKINRSVTIGADPDGGYGNERLGGTKTLSPVPSPLGISGVYTSDVIDCEQYPTLLLLIGADQTSVTSGVQLEWSDTEAFTEVRSTISRSFNTGHITTGLLLPERTRARYLRITFTNGLTAQGRFHINLRLNPTPLADEVSLRAASSGATGQQDVTTSPSRVASSPLVGRTSFRLKNLSSSARGLYYGFDAGTSVTNGDELAEGESVDLDIDEFTEVYVITTSTGGAGVRCSWTELA